jgi:hypothetical protein
MNRILDKYISNIVVFLVVLSYFHFFSFTMMPYSIRILLQIAILGIMVVFLLLRIIYKPEKGIRMNFAIPLLLMIIGALPCYFIAYAYHGQSFAISFFANKIIWFYLLYFFVHLYKIQATYIIRLIIFIGLFAVLLYYLQLYYYPTKILDINMLVGRGTIRLFVGGMLCTQAAYFYFLNQFFAKNKPVYLIFSLLTLSVFVLQGTRQLIFGLIFLTLVNLLLAKRIRSRFLITLVLSLASFSVFLIFRDIFNEITKVSALQAQNLEGGIRIKAARFFLTKFMPGFWAYIFGNGSSDLGSIYNQKIAFYAIKKGFYLADIGVLGDYIKYGVLFTLAGLYMLIKAIRFKISNELQFLKYYIFIQCFTLIAGYGILGGSDIVLILTLYVFDVNRANLLQEKLSSDSLMKQELSIISN